MTIKPLIAGIRQRLLAASLHYTPGASTRFNRPQPAADRWLSCTVAGEMTCVDCSWSVDRA